MKQKNFFKFIFYTLTIISTLVYIVYRIFFTLPTSLGTVALSVSILVLLIEIWEFGDFFIYYLNILTVNKKSPKIPDISALTDYPDIDVLIATFNENESILENTINSCKNMNYPDKSKLHIYLCDDGNMTSIKKLCEKRNVNYI